jgi:peptide/nickel transport system substrate-binding protein
MTTRFFAAATFAVLATVIAGPAGAAAKDTLSLGLVLEPPHLDPTAGAASAIREVVYANVFEGLTRIDATGEVLPALAQSWTVSADGLTYTFKLHPGVKFHDGAGFDCAIVKFSYERAAAPDSVNAQKGLFEPIAKTECPDPLTAIVTLKRPASTFLYNMAWGDAVMIAPGSSAGNKTNPIGTGPFRFKQWVKGDRVELQRNDAYWGMPAKLSAVTFKVVTDPSAAAAAMMAGDIDAFPNFPAPETLDQFRADPRMTVKIGTTEGKTILALNNEHKPFSDIRVRRALAYAIDRKAIIDGAMSGLGDPIGSHYTRQDPGFVDLAGTYPYDPAKAKQLLAEAGLVSGLSLTITLPPPAYARRSGEIIAAQLEQIGIRVTLVPLEWAQWLEQVFRQSNFDMTIIAHTEARDLDIYARDKYYFNYHSDAYNALYRKYLEALDPKTAIDLLGQIQRHLAEDEPNVFLFALPKVGVWNAKLQGLWANNPIPANDVTAVSWSD